MPAATVAVPAETATGERRVALVPEAVARLVGAGLAVRVEAGAGRWAGLDDEAFAAAGAHVVSGDVLGEASVVLAVRAVAPERLAHGVTTISFLPAADRQLLEGYASRRATAFAMELVPRISRAQSMDALTSQALVVGYRGAVLAAERLPRFFPLSMTAAGTVPPARVLVLGAGVAGLQAIATARRLGAVVSAYDVRSSSAEEVRSLGARFVELDLEVLEGAGGYAREMSEDRARRQQELLTPHVAGADAVILTAAVPGRRAPVLLTTDMVRAMRPGSVVIDLAADSGGNCEATVRGEEVLVAGVSVVGVADPASAMPLPASRLYSTNVSGLLLLMTADGVVTPDLDDDVLAGACLLRNGEPVHALSRQALGAAGAGGGRT